MSSLEIPFYLKDPKSNHETKIYIKKSINSKQFKYYTTESVNPDNWNFQKQKAKLIDSESYRLNDYLLYLSKIVSSKIKIFKRLYKGDEIDFDLLRKHIDIEIEDNPYQKDEEIKAEIKNSKISLFSELDDFIYLKSKKTKDGKIDKTDPYYKKYNNVRNKLIKFNKHIGETLTFDHLRKFEMYDLMMDFLYYEIENSTNTAGRFIGFFKTFVKFCKSKYVKELSDIDLSHWKKVTEEADVIFFDEEQLASIENFQYPEFSAKDMCRDVLVLLCHTGMRYSDYENLKPFHIKKTHIIKSFIKTKSKNNLIPLDGVTRRIIDKYLKRYRETGIFFHKIALKNFSELIKVISKDAGLVDDISLVRNYGKVRKEFVGPFYSFVSSHIGRRTFITLSLHRGMSIYEVMDITDHADAKSLKPYAKVSDKALIRSHKNAWD
ncbi:MAG: hypothetical protein CL843_09085 [Crocinitomicaceae bacterium]|nr:hypothetical protein [Crocinitomicaceae bacterium]|tara:strand:+ start:154 stop:1458 length:1305 start_codon:yes stop_codon:yes gene_type:complete